MFSFCYAGLFTVEAVEEVGKCRVLLQLDLLQQSEPVFNPMTVKTMRYI